MDLIMIFLAILVPMMLNEYSYKESRKKKNKKNQIYKYSQLAQNGYEVYKHGHFDYELRRI